VLKLAAPPAWHRRLLPSLRLYGVLVRFRLFRSRRPRYRGIAPLLAPGVKMSRREYEEWRDANTWDPARETELVVQNDLAPARWIEPRLVPDSFEVRMTVPQGFDAYARIFFPFTGADIEVDGEARQEHLTWGQIAQRNGRIVHAVMESEAIGQRPDTDAEPDCCCGEMGDEQLGALLPILTHHTSSPDGWFLLWDGFGDLNERVFSDDLPKVRHPGRSFYLLRGPLGSYGEFPWAPNYWWPDDRAWCVSTDVDFDCAYVAGSAACIEEILAHPVIDALATKPENPARSGMDIINDPDGIAPRSI
jgi:hypothetical protein